MRIHIATLRTTSLLILTACGPKATGEESEDKTPAALLEDACSSFCDRALSCPPSRYAEEWNFQDEQTCVSECLKFHATTPSDPPEMCVLIRADLWSCAGAIDTCELFDAFDDTTHAENNFLGNPCFDEFVEFINKCNY
jgi:hypothetical protein